MVKKMTALLMALFLVATGTAACGPDKNASQSTHNKWEDMPEEQLQQELQKMKDEGILDENGQPAPGVDLNDYPGLG